MNDICNTFAKLAKLLPSFGYLFMFRKTIYTEDIWLFNKIAQTFH